MKLNIAQVIGLNTDQKAAQVTSSERDGNSFFAVLSLTCDDAFTKGRQVLSELEDFYFESEGTVAEKLDAAFAEAQKKLSEQVTDWDLVLAAVSGKVLYLIGKGEVDVYLKRSDKISSLLKVASVQLVSGFINAGDKLVFSTRSLTAFLGSDFTKCLELPLESFEEEVQGKIGASELEEKGVAALAVEISEENVEISPVSKQKEEDETLQQEVSDSPGKIKAVFGAFFKKIIWGFSQLKTYFPKSGRGRLAIAIVLIVIALAGAGYKYKVNKDSEKLLQFNQIFASAKEDFEGAKGLASLNPAEAKKRLESAKDKVSKALVLAPKDQEANNFKNTLENESSSILQAAEVSNFPEFLDMDLVKKDFRAVSMSLSKDKLLLLDPGTKTLVVVDMAKKSNQILAGSDGLGEAVFASLNGSFAFVFSKDKGIIRVDSAKQKATTVSKADKDWEEIKDIYGFAGNIYLLDSGQIWKYLPAADGYSDKREYLTKGTKADLANAIRMQIESSVYVLKSDGEILRFTKGDKDNFSYDGLPSPVKSPKSLFVSSDTDNLYLLDSGNSRLLILTKTGGYKGQMMGSGFGSATDLVVDEKGKKVYLLERSKIYSVELK